jgi:SAM-dependent methyltransferase
MLSKGKNMHLKYLKSCRACGSKALKKVIDLGPQFLQGSFVKPGKEMPSLRKIPLELVRCDPEQDENACGLLQMVHSVPSNILYSAYWYRSGTNKTMTDHLHGIAASAMEVLGKTDARVLDIGCNDGTLLKAYPDTDIRFGVDPSDVAQTIGAGVTVVQDTFPSRKLDKVAPETKFDAITSIAMFYDLEDPVGFVADIARYLSQDGVWVFEMSYMPTMLDNNSYDTLCHEHLEYYSLSVLEHIVARAGMRIFRAMLNDSNGGSIRCFATRRDNLNFDRPEYFAFLEELRAKEFDLKLDTDKPYLEFQAKAEHLKAELRELLLKLKQEGKRIHIYGASTKGNTILQWCGIDHSIIDYAAERNPDKYGAKTLGTDIPIISEADSRKMKPDYYLALPWHFKKEFLERERETLHQGIGMIFPLPTIEIVNAERSL